MHGSMAGICNADASNKNLIWKFLGTIGLLLCKCLKHLANIFLHSLKTLPNVLLGKEHSTNILSVNNFLSSVFWSLVKDFIECLKTLDKENHLDELRILKKRHPLFVRSSASSDKPAGKVNRPDRGW